MSREAASLSLREKQRQERLELLLQATEQVFIEKGYRDASMDEIAARVGIGTATIYSHFSSKEDLMVAAILVRTFERTMRQIEEICAQDTSVTRKIIDIFHFLVCSDFFSRRVQVVYAMGDSPAAQEALLKRQQVLSENAEIFTKVLSTLIEQGKANGEFQQEIDTAAMLKAFVGLIRAQSVKDALLASHDVAPGELLQVYLQGVLQH